MCEPVSIISGIAGVASSVGGFMDAQNSANQANESATRDYQYALARREGDWNQQLSIWGNKKVDYQNDINANSDATSRAYASEQYRFNELFQQAAFQKQDILTQLVQAQGSLAASGKSGRTAAKLDQSMLAAFGRNNAIMSENLTSARSAMMQRNEDTRLQLTSANNKAWGQVAIAPTPGMAPPPPMMQSGPSGIGLAAGILSGAATAAGGFAKAKAPSGFDPGGKGGGFSATNNSFSQAPNSWGGYNNSNGFNAFNSKTWQV